MKRTLIIVACVMLVAAGIGCWRVDAPFRDIRQLDARYQQVRRGMTTSQVDALMGFSGQWQINRGSGFWDDAALPETEAERIRLAVTYSVPTFFLPVTFEISFDETGKVIGRHRYD